MLGKTSAQVTLLQPDPLVLAVSVDSPLATRTTVALPELGETPFIVYSQARVPAMHALMMYAFQAAGIQPPIAQEAVQVPTILALVESGLGVTLVPATTARLGSDGIRHITLTGMPGQMDFGITLATLPGSVNATARNFVALAQETTRETAQPAVQGAVQA